MLKSRKDMATRASDHLHTTILTQEWVWVHVMNAPPDLAVMPLSTLCCGVLLNTVVVFLPPYAPVRRLPTQAPSTSSIPRIAHAGPLCPFQCRISGIVGSTTERNRNRSLMLQKAKAGINMHPQMRAPASRVSLLMLPHGVDAARKPAIPF